MPAAPTTPASPLAPSRSPTACVRIVLPAPVSPVIAVRPAPGASSPSRTSTRFSIRRLRSKGPAVAAEERHLGERREQGALLADARDRARPRGRARRRGDRRRAPSAGTSAVRFQTISSAPRGTTSGRAWSACGATKVIAIASRPQTSTGRRSRGCSPSSPTASSRRCRRSRSARAASRRPAHSSWIIRPRTPLVTTRSLRRHGARCRPRRRASAARRTVLAGEDPREPGLELVPLDRGEEADAAEVDAEHRDPGTEVAGESAQHRPVAAENDDEVDVRVAVRGLEPVLLGLLGVDQQLDPDSRRRWQVAPAPSRSPAASRA